MVKSDLVKTVRQMFADRGIKGCEEGHRATRAALEIREVLTPKQLKVLIGNDADVGLYRRHILAPSRTAHSLRDCRPTR